MVDKVVGVMSKNLQTKVSLNEVDIDFFDKLVLNGLLIEDRKKDSLLYAGQAKVNLTDWFFLQKEIVFKTVSLSDAVINMKRTDSVWNYRFIIDYFSGPSTGGNKKQGPLIDIKEIHFNNIQFRQVDEWIGQSMEVSLQKMDLFMDSMNLHKKQIAIREILLDKPLFKQGDFEGKRPPSLKPKTDTTQKKVIDAFKWNNEGWKMNLGKLSIAGGSFINDKETIRAAYNNQFDGQHIHFGQINGSITNLKLLNDTIQANIDLSTKERSGFEVKKLASNLKFTPELMEFNQLELLTNKSKLGNYYAMSYESFNKDMSNFLSNVTLDIDFKESTLSSDDLAFFAPDLSTLKRVIHIEGQAKGTVENFTAKNLKLKTGNSFLDGNISMTGLPDIKTTFINLKSNNFLSNYEDLSSIIPSLKNIKQPSLAKLGNIGYRGNFTGFITDFVAYGNIRTNLGNFEADLNMKLPEGNSPPTYSGKINTIGFNLGQFIADKNFGIVALNGAIKGYGFTMNQLNANFKGDIHQLHYAGYNYTNAKVDGTLKNKTFQGHLSINDPNLKIKFLDGEFSFAKKEMAFNANADLEYINLKTFGISNNNIELSGLFNLHFKGNNIDDFLGSANVHTATLIADGKKLSFDSLTLRSFIQDSIKNLQLESNELYANLKGKFNVNELPNAFTVFLSKYYPSYIKAPKKNVSKQDFAFDIKTKNIDEYIRLFDKKLSGFNNADISGSIRFSENKMNIKANVPEFTYDGKVFTGVNFSGRGNRDTVYASINAENIRISDSLYFPNSTILFKAHNDLTSIRLITSANKNLSEAILDAAVKTYEDGVKIHFFPSTFVLNGKRWNLKEDGELVLRKNYPIAAQEINFESGEQHIILGSEMEEETNNINLVAQLKSVVMEDILPFFITNPQLKGKLTGTARIRDPFGTPFIWFNGITDSLNMNGEYIGKVNVDGKVNTQTGQIDFNANSNEQDYSFNTDGIINYKDTTGNSMAINFNGSRFRLNILQPYLKTVFSNVDGYAKGNLKLKSTDAAPLLLGNINIENGRLTLDYTKCTYLLNNQNILFGENSIDFGMLRIKDSLGNSGIVTGRIKHNLFDKFEFNNLRIETDKMALLNTGKADNDQFYGNVIGNAVVSLTGPASDMRLNIDGAPSQVDSSQIYLSTDAKTREGSQVDYIDFIQFGSEMDKDLSNTESSNMTVNLNINANPACKVDLILDEETGDIIKGQGNGNLNITVGTAEKLSIRGRYNLTAGQYTFNFQTFFKKYFSLSQGSITWNGDPFLASIDIDAEYLAKNVDLSPITVSGSGASRKDDIRVLAHLTGYLTNPEIEFELKFTEGSDGARDYFAGKKLEEFKNDKNNMFKQVASLLLLNSFISDQQSFITGQSTFNIAASTMGGIMSSWLTNLFNKELERATNGVLSSYIDINPTLNLQNQANELQANVRAGFKLSLSTRLKILIAGNYEYNNPYAQLYGKNILSPDISIEWLLKKDGSIRVVGFNRSSIDFTSAQRNMSGVQLAYRKEFDKLSDIFKGRKRLNKENENRFKALPDTTEIKPAL